MINDNNLYVMVLILGFACLVVNGFLLMTPENNHLISIQFHHNIHKLLSDKNKQLHRLHISFTDENEQDAQQDKQLFPEKLNIIYDSKCSVCQVSTIPYHLNVCELLCSIYLFLTHHVCSYHYSCLTLLLIY